MRQILTTIDIVAVLPCRCRFVSPFQQFEFADEFWAASCRWRRDAKPRRVAGGRRLGARFAVAALEAFELCAQLTRLSLRKARCASPFALPNPGRDAAH